MAGGFRTGSLFLDGVICSAGPDAFWENAVRKKIGNGVFLSKLGERIEKKTLEVFTELDAYLMQYTIKESIINQ